MQTSTTQEEPNIDAEQQAKEKQGVMQVAAQHNRWSVHYKYKHGTTKAELYDSGRQHDKGKALWEPQPSMTNALLYDRAKAPDGGKHHDKGVTLWW